MKKIKLFSKLLSVVSAGFMVGSASIGSALSAEKVVKLCFGEINSYDIRTISRHIMKFGIDEQDLLGSLNVKKYSEFLSSIDSEEAKKSFKNKYDSDEKAKDSVDFLFFINLINSVESGSKEKLIKRLVTMRNSDEHKKDKAVAREFDENFGTKIYDAIKIGTKQAKKA